MNLTLNLEAGTMSLGGGTGTNSGSLSLTNSLSNGGKLVINGRSRHDVH